MARLSLTHGRLTWKLIAVGGWITFLLTIYAMHPSSASLKQSFSTVFSSRPRELCSPRAWSAGQWKPIPPRTSKNITRPNDVFPYYGLEGCASDREYNWQLAADEDQWGRFPDVASYVWTPPKECDVRPLNREALIRDLVEQGGWLLVGDSVTENHFFSLSCLLYPHVRATPNYTENPIFDRAWPQNLYLNPKSPLVPHLHPPKGFDITTTPLVSFRRVDLLLTQDQLTNVYKALHPDRSWNDDFQLFGGDAAWEVAPSEYLKLFHSPLPQGNYATMVVSTAGHWTTGTFHGLKDESMVKEGLQNVLDFFDESMPVWASIVQGWLRGAQKGADEGRTAGGRKRQVVIRAYLPGHDGCHNVEITGPWETYEQANRDLSYNWGWISTFNDHFERILSSAWYPDIHFLPIDRPALLRPDAHCGGDCLHLLSGPGVLEGWTHYIWHYVSREIADQ